MSKIILSKENFTTYDERFSYEENRYFRNLNGYFVYYQLGPHWSDYYWNDVKKLSIKECIISIYRTRYPFGNRDLTEEQLLKHLNPSCNNDILMERKLLETKESPYYYGKYMPIRPPNFFADCDD